MYNISKNYLDDHETWNKCHVDDLWIFDKLILAKKLDYVCGPHGVSVPQKNNYIIRPCVNLMSMGRGAFFKELSPSMNDEIPEGYFWCEMFGGKHYSVDFHLHADFHNPGPDYLSAGDAPLPMLYFCFFCLGFCTSSHSTICTGCTTDTNTTYSQDAVANASGVTLRLTDSTGNQDDIPIVAIVDGQGKLGAKVIQAPGLGEKEETKKDDEKSDGDKIKESYSKVRSLCWTEFCTEEARRLLPKNLPKEFENSGA